MEITASCWQRAPVDITLTKSLTKSRLPSGFYEIPPSPAPLSPDKSALVVDRRTHYFHRDVKTSRRTLGISHTSSILLARVVGFFFFFSPGESVECLECTEQVLFTYSIS